MSHRACKYITITKFVQICILISFLQNVTSQNTRQPTPTPINQPTEFPTPIPYIMCCDCTIASNNAGCPIDPECEEEICINQSDTLCCDFIWDQLCAERADEICNPPTQSPTTQPTTSLPLCCACTQAIQGKNCPTDPICQSQICSQDTYCCNTQWDDICAHAAINICKNATNIPTHIPTNQPTFIPSIYPTVLPTLYPTISPTILPTLSSTLYPTMIPTIFPTQLPTKSPTKYPTNIPTHTPTKYPTYFTQIPTEYPSKAPTKFPTKIASIFPTKSPTNYPTEYPSNFPTKFPSNYPSISPTEIPLCCACTQHFNESIGCPDDLECEVIICDIDNACCSIQWDIHCAAIAQVICSNGTYTFPPTMSHTTTITPTPEPTPKPTFSPTMDPTDIPSSTQPTFDPTNKPTTSPTISPTIYPTPEPTPNPTPNPITLPTLIPTNRPTTKPTKIPTPSPTTKMPTNLPTKRPTHRPTVLPISEKPTFWPTMYVTPTVACDDCYKYGMRLVNIEQDNDRMNINDCSTDNNHEYNYHTTKPNKYRNDDKGSDNDSENENKWDKNENKANKNTNKANKHQTKLNKNTNKVSKNQNKLTKNNQNKLNKNPNKLSKNQNKPDKNQNKLNKNTNKRNKVNHKEKKTKGKRKWQRRILNAYYNNNDLYYHGQNYDKCALSNSGNAWGTTRTSYDCDSEICLTYSVIEYNNQCGALNAVFLPLCDTYNWMDITPQDLDSIITKVYPHNLNVYAAVLYDTLGIMVVFNELIDYNMLTICLENLSVDDNYYRHDFDKITLSNWVIFKIKNEYEKCVHNDGLPCFNFMFNSNCQN